LYGVVHSLLLPQFFKVRAGTNPLGFPLCFRRGGGQGFHHLPNYTPIKAPAGECRLRSPQCSRACAQPQVAARHTQGSAQLRLRGHSVVHGAFGKFPFDPLEYQFADQSAPARRAQPDSALDPGGSERGIVHQPDAPKGGNALFDDLGLSPPPLQACVQFVLAARTDCEQPQAILLGALRILFRPAGLPLRLPRASPRSSRVRWAGAARRGLARAPVSRFHRTPLGAAPGILVHFRGLAPTACRHR